MSKPIVSIVMPTYNRAKFINRTIDSILSQTFPDFELLVIDDASQDNITEILGNYNDARIKYFRHEKNKGAPAARNTGIQKSQTDFIAFMDDDDEWHPQKLEKQIDLFQRSEKNVGLIDTGYLVINSTTNETLLTHLPYRQIKNIKRKILLGQLVGSSSVIMVRKECFEKAGFFDETLKSGQDWEMWMRILDHYTYDVVSEILATVYMHGNQISSYPKNALDGKIQIFKKHKKEFEQYPDVYCIHSKRIGKLFMLEGYNRNAWQWFSKAIKKRPHEILKILFWLYIEFPKLKKESSE